MCFNKNIHDIMYRVEEESSEENIIKIDFNNLNDDGMM